MEQFNVSEDVKIEIDFQRPGIPFTASQLHPILFHEGEQYCCVWGPNLTDGIVGLGETPEQAIMNWDKRLTERMERADPNDSLIANAKKILNKVSDGDQKIKENLPNWKEGSPSTATQDSSLEKQGESTDDANSRKHTTDQSNADGSEFR